MISPSERITVQGSIGNIEIRNKETFIPIDGRFDGQRLKCSAIDQRGQVVFEKEAANALDVSYGPRINCTKQSVNKYSKDFEITCYISKNPVPNENDITLKRPNGEEIINGGEGISWKVVDVRVRENSKCILYFIQACPLYLW